VQGAAHALVDAGDLERADAQYARAIELSQRVGRAASDPVDRHSFFDGRALLFAEAMLVAAQLQAGARVTELATAYSSLASPAGRAAAARRLREYETALPVRGADLSQQEELRNRAARQLLAAAREFIK